MSGNCGDERCQRQPGRPWKKISPATLATSAPNIAMTMTHNALRHSRRLSSIVFCIGDLELI